MLLFLREKYRSLTQYIEKSKALDKKRIVDKSFLEGNKLFYEIKFFCVVPLQFTLMKEDDIDIKVKDDILVVD